MCAGPAAGPVLTHHSLVFGLSGSGERPAAILAAPARWPHTLTHKSASAHKPMISAHCRCVPGWHKQHKWLPFFVRDQTGMQANTQKGLMPPSRHTNPHTHTIPRARYRVHYCGMPQCFPLNTNCTQTPPGLTSVSNTGLQQTDMIA